MTQCKLEDVPYTMQTKPVIVLTDEIYDALFELAKRPIEWTLYGKANVSQNGGVIFVNDVIVPNQDNSSGASTVSEEAMGEWQHRVITEKKDMNTHTWSCWIHSHHTMGAFWSGTDQGNKALMQKEWLRGGSDQPVVAICVSTHKEKPIIASVIYPKMNLDLDAKVVKQGECDKQGTIPDAIEALKNEAITEPELQKKLEGLLARIVNYIKTPVLHNVIGADIDAREKKPMPTVYSNYNWNGGYDDDYPRTSFGQKKRKPDWKAQQASLFQEEKIERDERYYYQSKKELDADDYMILMDDAFQTSACIDDAGLIPDDLLSAIDSDSMKDIYADNRKLGDGNFREGYYICDSLYRICEIRQLPEHEVRNLDVKKFIGEYPENVIVYFSCSGSPYWVFMPTQGNGVDEAYFNHVACVLGIPDTSMDMNYMRDSVNYNY